MNKIKYIVLSLFLITGSLVFTSCEKYWGDKTDLSFIDTPKYEARAIAYVPILPILDKFVKPVDVIAGFDELIYVVDEGTHEVIALDVAGKEVGRIAVPGARAVMQDRRLQLLVIGTKDTVISSVSYSLSCIYRIEPKNTIYGISGGKIVNTIVHPFYFKSSFTSGDADVSLNGLGLMADNSFYVTRSGPKNSITQFGGPDDAVLVFNSSDKFITPVTVNTSLGSLSNYFKQPYGITTQVQAPQSYGITDRRDFIFTSLASSGTLKVQYITYTESDNGSSYDLKQLIPGDTSQAEGFLYSPSRFVTPYDVTYSGDGTNYIFVVDASKDSLFQFTNTGYEGVRPPAGSQSKKYVKVSFGGTGINATQFNQPRGVAYLNKIVYVADAGNHRLLRFKLTTDFQ